MKKYGFFGGSFNPVTKAHIELALEIVEKYNLDKVIFVPVGNFYNKPNLIGEHHRYNMLQIAIQQYEELEVSDIELNLNRPLTTLEAFNKIEKEYQDIDKYYIIGADNLNKIADSKDCNILAEKYKYIIIERESLDCKKIIESKEILKKNSQKFLIMNNVKHRKTSATESRNRIINNMKNTEELIEKEVFMYIKEHKLYKDDV